MPKRFLAAFLLSLAAAGAGLPARADLGIAVNSSIPYWSPAVAFDPEHNRYLVAFIDNNGPTNSDGSCTFWNFCRANISAYLLDVNGNRIGGKIAIAANNYAAQKNPAVAYNPDLDEFLVTWYDNRRGTTLYNPPRSGDFVADIYAQRVSYTGSKTGSEILVSTPSYYDYNMVRPRVAYNTTSDTYLIVWQGAHTSTMGNLNTAPWRVYAQRLTKYATRVGSVFLVSTWTSKQEDPDVVANTATGDFAVVWQDKRLGQRVSHDVYAQIIGSDGSRRVPWDIPVAADLYQGADDSVHERFPHATYNAEDNHYFVTWQASPASANPSQDKYGEPGKVYGIRIHAGSGSYINPVFSIDTSLSAHPAVTYCPSSDRYLVAWERPNTTLKARWITRAGSVQSTFTASAVNAKAPALSACGDGGKLLAVWETLPANNMGNIEGRLLP